MTIKEKIYEARAEIAKALAHKTRLKIIDILHEEGGHCVCELTEILDVSQSTVSKHLGVLKNAGVVSSKKEGLNVTYTLRIPCVKNFFGCLDQMIRENIEKKTEELKTVGRVKDE